MNLFYLIIYKHTANQLGGCRTPYPRIGCFSQCSRKRSNILNVLDVHWTSISVAQCIISCILAKRTMSDLPRYMARWRSKWLIICTEGFQSTFCSRLISRIVLSNRKGLSKPTVVSSVARVRTSNNVLVSALSSTSTFARSRILRYKTQYAHTRREGNRFSIGQVLVISTFVSISWIIFTHLSHKKLNKRRFRTS